jgi:hypothetical protein
MRCCGNARPRVPRWPHRAENKRRAQLAACCLDAKAQRHRADLHETLLPQRPTSPLIGTRGRVKPVGAGPLDGLVRLPHSRGPEILGLQPRVLRNTGKHSWADFFAIMERKDEVRPALASERAV